MQAVYVGNISNFAKVSFSMLKIKESAIQLQRYSNELGISYMSFSLIHRIV